MPTKALTIGIAAVLAVGIAVIALTAGGDHHSEPARETDGAFIVAMTPHHESAIEMAEIALRRAEHSEVRQLARQIVAAQASEIDEMGMIHTRLFGVPVSKGEHGTLGLESHQMGMNGDAAMLADAEPFDREFIDMMVPHHQGAIRMARVELQSGESLRLIKLARAIVAAQGREIEQMNVWRERWYGSPSATGGVSAEEEAMPDHSMMEH